MQFQYMGPQLIVVCGYALAMLLGAAVNIDAAWARLFAAFMPAVALIALTGLGKSARCRMEEIEITSRFSLRMIKILRLVIIGIAGVAVMLVLSFVLRIAIGADLLSSFALAGIPYLLTTFFCMLLIRKWHSAKNIYGCIAIAFVVCLTVFCGIRMLALYPAEFCRWFLSLILLLSIILTVIEVCKYLKESEELQWNLS